MNRDRLFQLKFLALLHDPPHKVWYIGDNIVCFSNKGHEEEARQIREKIAEKLGVSEPPNWEGAVGRADEIASSFDRWVITGAYLGQAKKAGYFFKYEKMHNIFYPRYSVECGKPSKEQVAGFFQELFSALEKLKRKGEWRLAYNALYSLYELLWINMGLPTPLADTRSPTHTIFDHLYASAAVMNWVYGAEEPSGYLVMVDIPGIQSIVSSSRKAGDFWAGSWMLSMITWMTVWPFVWDYGPDILLTPTSRLNPYYYTFLYTQLENLGETELARELKKEYEKFLGFITKSQRRRGEWEIPSVMRFPLIPATATLVLPSDVGNKEHVEAVIRENFKRAYECIESIALGGKAEGSGDACVLLAEILGTRLKSTGILDQFSAFLKGLEKAFENLLHLRVYVVDVGNVYRELLEDPLVGELADSLGASRHALAEKLLFNTVLREGLEREIREKISMTVFGKQWFDEQGQPLVDYSKYTSLKSGDWIPCTQCLGEPALIKFGKTFSRGVLDYDDATKRMLSNVLKLPEGNTEEILKELKKVFKPGEALGPLCLLKRLLYLRLSSLVLLKSLEDVAFAWYVPAVSGFKGQIFDEKMLTYLDSEDKDIESIMRLDAARTMFNQSVRENAKREHLEVFSERYMEVYSGLFDRITTGGGGARPAVKHSALFFRDIYAILKADGDSVGKLVRGEIPIEYYIELLENLQGVAAEKGGGEAIEDIQRSLKFLEAFRRKTENIPLSPTYMATLSLSLMVVSLKDAADIDRLKGMLVFTGGDDLLAILPADTALKAVEEARRNYSGWDDTNSFFHKINNYYVPAIAPYGRSASLRFASITDIMKEEIATAIGLLEDNAKRAEWEGLFNGRLEKDTVVVSASWSDEVALLPLRDLRYLRFLELLWLMRVHGLLSGNLPEDYSAYAEACRVDATGRLTRDVLSHVLARNLTEKGSTSERVKVILGELEGGSFLEPYKSRHRSIPLVEELIKAYRVLRRIPAR